MPSWNIAQVAEEIARRRLSQSPLIERMMDVRDRYNADIIVPVPDVDDDIPLSCLAPLLIAAAVDNTALYAAQARPTISVPALDAGSTRSTDYASRRRKALGKVWDKSWMDLVLGRMYRHLAGYATSALVVELDHNTRLPRICVRDPLSAYPEPKAPEDLTPPENCGFVFGRSLDWLHKNFPATRERFQRGAGFSVSQSNEGELWDCVEWVDDDQVLLGVLGPRDAYRSWTREPREWAFELSATPNVIGRCPAVVPRRVTLDRIVSQLAHLIGHADMIAKLTYLDIRATEKSIYPDRYIMGKVGQNPRLVGHDWKGGETGEVNIIQDADAIGELRGTPDPNNKMTVDRLERNLRISSGLVPQTGGETYGALRTGRGIDALMGAALDPKTAELHRVGERYLSEVNELVLLGFAKRWPGSTYAVGFPTDTATVEFVPSKHVELLGHADGAGRPQLSLDNRVTYPIPGMDDANATVVIGQMLAAGLVPQRDARRMHPHVGDPDGAERQLLVEQLEGIAVAMLGERAQKGGITPADISRMIELAYDGLPLHKALAKVDEEASQRQAQVAPAPEPGMAMPPEMMPGLANPGEGAEMQAPPQIQPPNDDMMNLRAIVGALQEA
mgnify:CR=1 FL=1